MKFILITFLLFCILNGIQNTFDQNDDILILTDENYNQTVNLFHYLLVEIYSPFDKNSKKIDEEFMKLSILINDKHPGKIQLAKLDATANQITAQILSENMSNFPTIFFYENQIGMEYLGQENASKILKWIEVQTGLGVIQVNNIEQLDKLINENEVFILGLYTDFESFEAKLFIEITKDFYDVNFGISISKEILNEYHLNGNGNVIAFKQFEERKTIYTGLLDDKEAIKIFINAYKLPLLINFEVYKSNRLINNGYVGNMYLFISKSSEKYQNVFNEYKEAAEQFRGRVIFSIVDLDIKENEHLIEYFGLKKYEFPTLRITTIRDQMIKFRPDRRPLTLESITKFSQDFLDGKLSHYLLSEDIPDDWNKGLVKKLVGKNFNQTVRNKKRSVLVRFYAPWCLYSKKVGSLFEKVAEEFKRSKEHLVAEIDATANEIEDIIIDKFPTIKLFPKGSDEIIEYDGFVTQDNLIKFLENHGRMDDYPEHDEL